MGWSWEYSVCRETRNEVWITGKLDLVLEGIRLDEDFEVFLKVETELWSFSLDVAIWDF
jgi:hypothetical protein